MLNVFSVKDIQSENFKNLANASMKKLLISILSVFFAFSVPACGQQTASVCCQNIKNKDFEQAKVSAQTLPADWNLPQVKGYSSTLDQTEKHAGKSSFKISNTDSTVKGYQTFSQVIPLTINKLKRLGISVYIKTKDVKGEVATWCQLWDKNDKQVGFQNLGLQQGPISGSGEWKKYTLNLTVDQDIKKLFFGSYLGGTGSVWFDDFEVEEITVPDFPPSSEAVKYINDFASIIKKNSIYKDSLNWSAIDEGVSQLSRGAKNIDEAKSVVNYILGKLHQAGDNHSFIQSPTVAKAYATGNTNPRRTSSRLIENHIGYISVPGFGSVDQQAKDDFAKDIQDRIKTLDSENEIDYWIVDLRGNNGGNMYPMIAGLGPLTGEGILGYFVKGGAKMDYNKWSYDPKKGKNGSGLGVNIDKPYQLRKPDSKIAVLVGGGTGSSGEMTAISFIGRANTKLFGQATGGYTSANAPYNLSDGSVLLLAVSYTADRNKKEYKSKIQPDVLVKETQGDDVTLKTAQNWLLDK
jgi:hypothetical protein